MLLELGMGASQGVAAQSFRRADPFRPPAIDSIMDAEQRVKARLSRHIRSEFPWVMVTAALERSSSPGNARVISSSVAPRV
jgi:hypothetical protein